MDLTFLRSFLVIADSGGISTAAARLGVTQPALSRRLRQLEEELGAQLVVRGRKGAQLTPMGEVVQAEASALVARYDRLYELIATHQRLAAGTVRIGGGATAVSFIFPEAIAEFQTSHPEVRFQVREAGSSEIARAVATGELELGVITLPVHDKALEVLPIAVDRIVLVARADHPLAKKPHAKSRDLAAQPIVAFEAGSAVRRIVDNKLRAAGVEVNVVMELRSIPAILRMVATTGNLAFVSQLSVEGESEVVAIPVKGLRIERRLGVAYRRGMPLSPAAKAFCEQLRSA